MEAKDTVITQYQEDHRQIAEAQAKISFPAGKAEGRREVVDWVKHCPYCGSYLPKNLNGTRTLKCSICDWDGQAQLKEWGIEQSQESSTSPKE